MEYLFSLRVYPVSTLGADGMSCCHYYKSSKKKTAIAEIVT